MMYNFSAYMRKGTLYVFFPLLFLLILLTYGGLFSTFYQQDEWNIFGNILTQGLKGILGHFSIVQILSGAGRPFSIPIHYFLYRYFPFQIFPFALLAILLHFLNSILLFFIVRKISKDDFLAFASSVFFATASILQQAVAWTGANTTVLPSTFFAFLSTIFYLQFLQNRERRKLIGSFIFFIISILFKESGVFLSIFFPILFILNKKKFRILDVLKTHFLFFLFGLYVGFARISHLIWGDTGTQAFVRPESYFGERIILHLFMYPLEAISQVFIYPTQMFKLADSFGKIAYPRLWVTETVPIINETIASEMLSIIFSVFIIATLFLIFKKYPEKRNLVSFSIALFFLSFIPFIVIIKDNAYLESRHYYVATAAAGIFFSLFLTYLWRFLSSNLRLTNVLAWTVVLMLAAIYFFGQITLVRGEIKKQSVIGQERKTFLDSLKSYYPNPPKEPVFYVTGSRDYYIKNNNVPFQQGMGFTLMVFYYDTGIIPKELIIQNYLWDLNSQGYRQTKEGGFGYFWDKEELKREIKKNKIPPQRIIGLFYDANEKKLLNITDDLKKYLLKNSVQ